MGAITKVLEGTFALILAYLVLANFQGFSSAMRSIGELYTSSVKALQAR